MYDTNMCSVPYPTTEQQIQIAAMLSRQFHEEQTQFRERISQLINKKDQSILSRKDLAQHLNRRSIWVALY